jgi:WD40 repeat protein/serine/threonine protein kinase
LTSDIDALPTRFGRYEVLGLIGSGAFADVVRAWDEGLASHVAIKVLNTEAAADELARERFIEEGKLLRRVASPYVLAVHDLGELDDGRPYLVLQLADGGTLDDRIEPFEGRAVDTETVRRVVEAMADGLDALHRAGVVHRDIKPENLLIDTSDDNADTARPAAEGASRSNGPESADGESDPTADTVIGLGVLELREQLVIADLGLAKDLTSRGSAPSVIGGSARYQAPEQLRADGELGPPTDIYAASAVLWRLLSGRVAPEPHDVSDELTIFQPGWQGFFARAMALDPADRYPSAVAWRSSALDQLDVEPEAVAEGDLSVGPRRSCPYKGLASFQPEDASVFFGREDVVGDLLRRLQTNRVLVVAGPSGSGKSSLVRAGLLPALRSGAIAGSESWHYELLTPGIDPFDELHYRLTRDVEGKPRYTADELAADPRLARRLLDDSGETSWLLYIDQFEEVFTQHDDPEVARSFVDALSAMADPTDSRLRLVVAVRADFYGRCAQIPWLAQRITENQVLVGPMGNDNMRRAIEEPARRNGLRFEPGLVDLVLDEGGQSAGSLPLISHALVETWSRRDGNVLTLDGFKTAGGVGGAIAQSADALYEITFDEDQQRAAKRLLLRLVTPGEGTADTRRPLPFSELERDSESEVMATVVDEFVSARLLAVDDKGVEIAHEALIGGWPRLRDWIDAERQDLRFRQRVSRAASEWESADRDPDLLWRGTPLAAAVDWTEEHPDGFDLLEQEFVDAAEEARLAEEAARAQRAARSAKTRRRATLALAALTLASVVASIVAFIALRRATSSTEVAERQFANALGTSAVGQARDDPRIALRLAMESAERSSRPPVDARAAMVQARVALSEPGVVPFGPAISTPGSFKVALRPDGLLAAVSDPTGPVRLYDVATGEQVGDTLRAHTSGARTLTFTPDGATLVTGASDDLVFSWDVADPENVGEPRIVSDYGVNVWSVAVHPTDGSVAVSYDDGAIRVFDLASGTEKRRLDWDDGSGGINAVAFSPDGTKLVASNRSGRLNGWATADYEKLWDPLDTPEGPKLWEIVFSPDGSTFATSGDRPVAYLHDAETGLPIEGKVFGDLTFDEDGTEQTPTATALKGIAFSADGRRLIAGSAAGTVHTWAIDDPSEPPTTSAVRHSDAVEHGDISIDGTVFATVGDDKRLRLWRAGDVPLFEGFDGIPNGAYGAAFDPTGNRLAVGDGDGGLHIVDLDDPAVRSSGTGHDGLVWDVVWSPDGAAIYTTGDDGTVRRWDADSVVVTDELGRHQGPGRGLALSPDGRFLVSSDRGDGDGNGADVFVWDTAQGSLFAQPMPHEQGVRALAFSPDGALLATADGVGQIRIWDTDDFNLVREWPTNANIVWALSFNDEGMLASVDGAEDVHVFDPTTGLEAGITISGLDTNGGTGVGFAADGLSAAVLTRRGELLLVDWQQGVSLMTSALAAHPGEDAQSFELAFESEGGRFATTSTDGTVRVWDVLSPIRACEEAAQRLDPSIVADVFDGSPTNACADSAPTP